jgi:hypothetical protein
MHDTLNLRCRQATNIEAAKIVAKHALAAIREGNLGYAIIAASKAE